MKDIITCLLLIISIKVAQTYFPSNKYIKLLIFTIGLLYFIRKLWFWIKKHSSY